MQTHEISLGSKAFGEHADPGLIVAYRSHQDALHFLSSVLSKSNGFALLQGPTGSGKSTVIREQRAWFARDASVALVEGAHLTPRRLLTGMLSQFGIEPGSEDDDQLLHKLNNFVAQETRFARPPVLMIDNADHASPSALRLVNWLAALEARGRFALRMVLTGKEGLTALPRRDGMRNLARRQPATYCLNPMTDREAQIYLRTRLLAAGAGCSEEVFPMDVCDGLFELSRGWPGALNEQAIERVDGVMARRPARPIPRVIVTRDGEIIAEYRLTEKQYVIGRARFANILIEDAYASKLHALLRVHANAVILADLNSTNGTTVNSRIVTTRVLRNNDIIMLGQHRLKIENVPAMSPEMDELIDATDTITMRSLDDLRLARARRAIAMLKHQ